MLMYLIGVFAIIINTIGMLGHKDVFFKVFHGILLGIVIGVMLVNIY